MCGHTLHCHWEYMMLAWGATVAPVAWFWARRTRRRVREMVTR